MPKHRVRANNPALPIITRRTILAAPTLGLLPGMALGGETAQQRIQHHAESLLAEIEAIAPEGATTIVCRVHRLSGPVTFEAQSLRGVIRILNQKNMVWS